MSVQTCLPRLFFIVVLAFISLIGGPGIAQNAVPMLVNYQGELRDPTTGDPVGDGAYPMLFRIYDVEMGGTHLWEEIHSTLYGNAVEVTDGIFSVFLGSGTGDVLTASIFNGPNRWLEIRVETETMSPRQRITSSAYSMISEDSRLLNGKQALEFADAGHAHSGGDITSGIVSEDRLDAAIARDSETDAAVTTHAAIANAHHDRYTDAEAVSAMGTKADTNPLHHDKTTTFSDLTDSASDSQIPAGIARDTEVDSKVMDHAALTDAHHAKTTSFAELTDTATDAQIPDTITVNYATSAGDADTVDGVHAAALEESAEIDADITAHAGIADAHHSRYTNSEAVSAMGTKSDANPLNHDKTTSLPWGSITSVPAGFADGIDNDSGAACWSLTGNAGTVPGVNFLGTTDGQALELRVGNARALRLETNAECPNIVAGHEENAVTSGVVAATIGGGGASGFANLVTDDWGTVGGGALNQVGDNAGDTEDAWCATVGGGYWNEASGRYAAVGGGSVNQATADFGTVGGGTINRAGSDDGDPSSAAYATVGGGGGNKATGQRATIGGGSANTASGFAATIPGGDSAKATCYGQQAYASGTFPSAEQGAAQTSLYVVRNQTTSSAPTELFLDGSSQRMNIPVGSTWMFEALVVARTQDSGGLHVDSGGYLIHGVIQNADGHTSMRRMVSDHFKEEDPLWASWAEGDNLNDALVIKVEGGSDPMRWVATVRTSEVMFPQ